MWRSDGANANGYWRRLAEWYQRRLKRAKQSPAIISFPIISRFCLLDNVNIVSGIITVEFLESWKEADRHAVEPVNRFIPCFLYFPVFD